jgi:hypothetical protein
LAQLAAQNQRGVGPLEPGSLVDERYRIVRPLASGGMGVVYEAERVGLGLPVAIKFPKLEGEGDERRATRLAEEARYLARLQHENIVRVIDVGEAAGAPYLVLEFVAGKALSDALEEGGPMQLGRAHEVVRQVARGLGAAHAAGVIHRDLKASNIMLTQRDDGSDFIKVLDFGIARQHRVGPSVTTATGAVGTVAYMAPEVARGESRGSVQADLFALGVVFYELLTARRPHEGDSPNAILYSLMTKEFTPLERHRVDLPDLLGPFFERALAKDPALRPQSVGEWMMSLEQALAGVLRAPERPERNALLEDGIAQRTWPQRVRRFSVLGGICGLVLGVAVGWVARAVSMSSEPRALDAGAGTQDKSIAPARRELKDAPSNGAMAALVSAQPAPSESTKGGRAAEPVSAHDELAVRSAVPAGTPAPAKRTAERARGGSKPKEPRLAHGSSSEPSEGPVATVDSVTGLVSRNPYQ